MKIKNDKYILIVDDSVDSQELLTTLFESIGYSVHHVSNGVEALALLSTSGNLPDVILLDYNMPMMNGSEFRTRQLENIEIRAIPVIVMTGETKENIFQIMQNPQAILIKPMNIQKIIQTVQSVLSI